MSDCSPPVWTGVASGIGHAATVGLVGGGVLGDPLDGADGVLLVAGTALAVGAAATTTTAGGAIGEELAVGLGLELVAAMLGAGNATGARRGVRVVVVCVTRTENAATASRSRTITAATPRRISWRFMLCRQQDRCGRHGPAHQP